MYAIGNDHSAIELKNIIKKHLFARKRKQERKDVEVVDHDAPAEQLDADKVGGAADHLDKVIALGFLLEKANLVRDAARNVVNRLVFFRSVA